MVAVERVGRYVEQIDAINRSRQYDMNRIAVERQLKSKIVSGIVLWTLHNRRRFRESLLCAAPPGYENTNYAPYESQSQNDQEQYVREYRVMEDTERIDEYDEVVECGTVAEDFVHDVCYEMRSHDAADQHLSEQLHKNPSSRNALGTNFSIEYVEGEDLKASIAKKVTDAIQEISKVDPNPSSSARTIKKVDIAIRVHHDVPTQEVSKIDQLEIPRSRSWWSSCFLCGEL